MRTGLCRRPLVADGTLVDVRWFFLEDLVPPTSELTPEPALFER